MLLQRGLRVIIIPMHGRLLDGLIHSLDLTIRPRMRWESEPMLDPVFLANSIENMWQSPVIPSLIRKLHAVVRQNRMNFVWNFFDQIFQKLRRLNFSLFFKEFDVSKFTRAIDRHEQIQLARLRANLCDINVKIANRILFELLFRFFLLIFRQFADSVALKKPM